MVAQGSLHWRSFASIRGWPAEHAEHAEVGGPASDAMLLFVAFVCFVVGWKRLQETSGSYNSPLQFMRWLLGSSEGGGGSP